MLFCLLAGCGLFHELEPWASDDTGRTVITDTGTVITDTGTGVTTDTGTVVTETGDNLPSVSIALYAMTIRDNGPINIETYDISTGMNADSSPTSLSGSSGASNGLILTTDNRLFATGNEDSLLEGFSIDDQTGLLNVEGWLSLIHI